MRLRITVVALCAWFLVGPPSQGAQAVQPRKLDRLVERVNEFWTLLQAGKKGEALAYVEKQGVEIFLAQHPPRFLSFFLEGLTLTERPDAVQVNLKARIGPPYLPQPVDWPVEQLWVRHEGEWFLHVEKGDPKALFRRRRPGRKGLDRRKFEQELALCTLSDFRIQLGKVKQGQPVEAKKIVLHNGAPDPVRFRLVSAPPWIIFRAPGRRLRPGQEMPLTIGAQTSRLDGPQKVELELELRLGQARLHKKILVEIEVRAPLSLTPPEIMISGKSSKLEIRIRNNLERPVVIRQVVPPADFIRIEHEFRNIRLEPGAEATLRLSWGTVPRGWIPTGIQLVLDHPVDGRPYIEIPIRLPSP